MKVCPVGSSGTSKVALKLPLAVVFTVVGFVDTAKPPTVTVIVTAVVVVVPLKPRPDMLTPVSLVPEVGLMVMSAAVVKVCDRTVVLAVLGP